MTRDQPLTDRRRFLAAAAFATTGVLAGCAGGGSDGDNGGTDSADDETDDGTDESRNGNGGTDESENGNGGTETPSGDTETPESDSTEQLSVESMCEAGNIVDELSIVGCQSEIQGDNFVITATVRNDGDQQTAISDYTLRAWVYESQDTSGRGIQSSLSVSGGSFDIAPGETDELTFTKNITADDSSPDDIQRYVIEIYCGTIADGVYCS